MSRPSEQEFALRHCSIVVRSEDLSQYDQNLEPSPSNGEHNENENFGWRGSGCSDGLRRFGKRGTGVGTMARSRVDYGYYGYGPGALAADVIGGTVAAVTSPLWAPGYYDYYPGYAYAPRYYGYSPGYAYGPAYAAPGTVLAQSGPSAATIASCEARFRSYNASTGMYTGYDGQQHPCP